MESEFFKFALLFILWGYKDGGIAKFNKAC